MPRRLLSLLALAAASLLGCAGSMPPSAMPSAVAEAPPPPPAPEATPAPAGKEADDDAVTGNLFGAPAPQPSGGVASAAIQQAPSPPPRMRQAMIIYTASLVLAVYEVEQNLTKIEDLAKASGGYLSSRTDDAITVRIPRERFDDVLAQVEKLGDVLHRKVLAEDVTDQVVDLEARLKNARAMRDRLTQLLSGAQATKDALEIERELGRVMGDIEKMEGRLKVLSDKLAYSTLTVTFQPHQVAEVHDTARLPFPWLEELGLPALLRVK